MGGPGKATDNRDLGIGGRLVGWLVRRFTGPVVPFSEQGRTVALLSGGEPPLIHEVILLVVRQEVVLEVVEQEMAYLEGRPGRGKSGA